MRDNVMNSSFMGTSVTLALAGRINKEFMDRQKAANKEFWFSHDPFSPRNEQFFCKRG